MKMVASKFWVCERILDWFVHHRIKANNLSGQPDLLSKPNWISCISQKQLLGDLGKEILTLIRLIISLKLLNQRKKHSLATFSNPKEQTKVWSIQTIFLLKEFQTRRTYTTWVQNRHRVKSFYWISKIGKKAKFCREWPRPQISLMYWIKLNRNTWALLGVEMDKLHPILIW